MQVYLIPAIMILLAKIKVTSCLQKAWQKSKQKQMHWHVFLQHTTAHNNFSFLFL